MPDPVPASDLNNELLQSISDALNNQSDQLDQMQEYLIIKDQQEQENQAIKEEEDKDKAETEANEKEAAEQVRSEQTAKADEQAETYTELLTDINDNLILQNQQIAVQSVYFGIIAGLLAIKIFIDRMFK